MFPLLENAPFHGNSLEFGRPGGLVVTLECYYTTNNINTINTINSVAPGVRIPPW